MILKKILPIFSYLFHPLFSAVGACFFYFLYRLAAFELREIRLFFLQIVIITVVTPMALHYLLRYIGKLDSLMIADTEQRKMPLVFHCFLLLLLLRQTVTLERFPELHFFFLSALFSTLIALALLFVKVKASLHMLGISALTVFVFGLNMHSENKSLYVVPFLLVINGFVASSRLIMQAHTPKELVIGMLLGALPQLLFLFLWL